MKSEIRNPKSEGNPKAETRRADGARTFLSAVFRGRFGKRPADRNVRAPFAGLMNSETRIGSPACRGHLRVRSSAFGLRNCFGFRISAFGFALLLALPSHAALVYETASEFLSSGDFNGDGRPDVLVLDKLTGNARVGYQDINGALTWSLPFVTGADPAGAVAVGRFTLTNREAIAVTSPQLNRIQVVKLASPGDPGPVAINPTHAGTTLLVGLDAPYGTNAPRSWLNAGAQDPGVTLVDLFAFIGDSLSSFQDQIAAEGPLSSASAFRRSVGGATLLAAIRRGSNDTFVAYAYTNTTAPVLVRSNLPSGTEYVFGHFHGEPNPRLLFYVPGQSNIIVQPLVFNGSTFAFGAATLNTFASAVQRVFYVDEGTNGLAVIQFGDGVVGLRPPIGSGQLQVSYGFGLGPAGNIITGVAPLGIGRLALLSASSNSFSSTHAQIYTQTGTNYTLTSTSTLPRVTTTATRGNVWLFQTEPFTSSAATLIASLSAPVWSSAASGLPGALAVRVESDGGTATGLGNPATNSFGAAPAGTAYALPNQYREDISFFSYAAPRAAEPSVVTISPPPGAYTGPISISFIKQNAAHDVFYRKSGAAPWQLYAAAFSLTNDATLEFYGQVPGGARARTQSASYALGNAVLPPATPVTLPGSETNVPPVVIPGIPQISPGGTVFYSRGPTTSNSIWAINLDGSSEMFLTSGREPRVSRNGRWMAFRRENDPLPNQHSLWLRELPTGQEVRWHTRSNGFVGYDWLPGNTNLVFAADGLFWRLGMGQPAVAFPLSSDIRQGAPSVNPVDGRVALQVIYPGSTGLYLAPPGLTSRQNLGLNILSPRWPAWSPDGAMIAVADDPNISPVLAAGRNFWVVKLSPQTNSYQITSLGSASNGFPNGVVWSPDGGSLVGAGRISGSNGLWVVPLTADRTACLSAPRRLPTSPGADLDFAGSVVSASTRVTYTNLGLFIRLDPAAVVVYWTTNYDGFALESALEMPAGLLAWTPVGGPYFRAGPNFEYREARTALSARKYFRLRYPGVLVLTPPEPGIGLRVEPTAAVLTWPLNYVGYTLEAATNLTPPVLWTPLPGAYQPTNGVLEYRRGDPRPAQEFYRLRGP